MNLKSKRFLSLQNLFELRRIHSVNERYASGRVFYHKQLLGLTDESGLIWPICKNEFLKQIELQEGDWIAFKCKIHKVTNHEQAQNENYLIVLTEIFEHVENKSAWDNPKIVSPIPNKNDINTSQLVLDNIYTLYQSSKTKKRFQLIQKRNKAIERTALFFKNKGFINIETPTLVPSGGIEVYLNPFATTYTDHRNKKWQLELPTSPEFALKKIMTEGVEKIFQLSRAYRNHGEVSRHHEPEFIMLEWYRANSDLEKIMEDTQKLVQLLSDLLGSTLEIPKQWPKFRIDDLFKKNLNLDLEKLQERDQFYTQAKHLSPSITVNDDWDTLFYKLFMEKIEPFLLEQKACFVTHYPIQMGALATQEKVQTAAGEIKLKPYVERMEAYLYGVEICNGYFELNDAAILLDRFNKTKSFRKDLQTDSGFEKAMQFGLPTCSGNALGIDRVIATLLELKEISLLFPIPFLSQFPTDSVAWE